MGLIFRKYPDLTSPAFNRVEVIGQTTAARFKELDYFKKNGRGPGVQMLTTHSGEEYVHNNAIRLLGCDRSTGETINNMNHCGQKLTLQSYTQYAAQLGDTFPYWDLYDGGRYYLQLDWIQGTALRDFSMNGQVPNELTNFGFEQRAYDIGSTDIYESFGPKFSQFIAKFTSIPSPWTKGCGLSLSLIPADIIGVPSAFMFGGTAGTAAGLKVPEAAMTNLAAMSRGTHQVVIRTDANVTVRQTIFAQRYSDTSTQNFQELRIEDGMLKYIVRSVTMSYPVEGRKLYHICCEHDNAAGTARLYVDGKLVAVGSGISGTTAYTGNFCLGLTETSSSRYAFKGQLGLYRYFNLLLRENFIKRLDNNGRPRAYFVADYLCAQTAGSQFLYGMVLEVCPWAESMYVYKQNNRGPLSFNWVTVDRAPSVLYTDWETQRGDDVVEYDARLQFNNLILYQYNGLDTYDPQNVQKQIDDIYNDEAPDNTLYPLVIQLNIPQTTPGTNPLQVSIERMAGNDGLTTFDISGVLRRGFTDVTPESKFHVSYRIMNSWMNPAKDYLFHAINAVHQPGEPNPFGAQTRVLNLGPALRLCANDYFRVQQAIVLYNPTNGQVKMESDGETFYIFKWITVFDSIDFGYFFYNWRQLPVIRQCMPQDPLFVRWISAAGGYETYAFPYHRHYEQRVRDIQSLQRISGDRLIRETISAKVEDTLTTGADGLARDEFDWLRTLPMSPCVELYDEEHKEWRPVSLNDDNKIEWDSDAGLGSVEFEFLLPTRLTQF